MGLEAKVDVVESDDLISVEVSGPKMGILIGHRVKPWMQFSI